MSSQAFLARFGSGSSESDLDAESQVVASQALEQGGVAAFISKFAGVSESYWFYNNTVEVRFDAVEHKYFRVGELGELVPLLNVSTVSKIVDRSPALIPWAAKVTVEKMLRTIPTVDNAGVLMIPPLTLEKFTELAMAAKSAHSDKLEDAGACGKMAHDWLEHYIKALMADDQTTIQGMMTQMCPDPRATNAVLAALDWMKGHNVRWLSTERKLYSKEHECSGTLDGLCITDSCNDPSCCPKAFKDRRTLIDWKTSNYLYVEFVYQASAYKAFYQEEFPEPENHVEDIWILRLGKDDAEFQPWHLDEASFDADFAGFVACLILKRCVTGLEERMKEQKSTVREAKKKMRAEQREKDKAEEKRLKAIEKEKKKLERAEIKERVKAEAKAERERLKAEKKKEKETACTSTSTLNPDSGPLGSTPQPMTPNASEATTVGEQSPTTTQSTTPQNESIGLTEATTKSSVLEEEKPVRAIYAIPTED